MKNDLRVPGDKTLMANIYKYISQNAIGFITT